jgi:hypothetical protein
MLRPLAAACQAQVGLPEKHPRFREAWRDRLLLRAKVDAY